MSRGPEGSVELVAAYNVAGDRESMATKETFSPGGPILFQVCPITDLADARPQKSTPSKRLFRLICGSYGSHRRNA
jgi:hypothetical protein